MFQRAEQIRNAFFSGGATLGVKFSITPSFLSPDTLRSVFTLDGTSVTYRHGPPRTTDLTWPNRGDASTASVIITLVEGGTVKEERSGAWALFRLLYTTGMQRTGSSGQYTFSVANKSGARADYTVQASSVVNPLAPGVIQGFQCPGQL
jgi:type VI secretion system protein ImpL